MWICFALGSAFFAGLTSILAKCGIKDTDSNVATAIRTIVVLIFSWLMVLVVGSFSQIKDIDSRTLLFLVLSGLSTGASWLCYFKALQIGDVNKVVSVDKSSTILTVILAFIILGEPVSAFKLIGLIGIGVGTYLMIEKKENTQKANGKSWFFFASFSAIFASLNSILGKIGIVGIDSNLGTAIRTTVVLIMAWIVVFTTKKQSQIKSTSKRELVFILLSGIATGLSWLCYYKALQDGDASVVVPIDKLSIIITIIFSHFVFKERLSLKTFIAVVLMVIGTLLMLF